MHSTALPPLLNLFVDTVIPDCYAETHAGSLHLKARDNTGNTARGPALNRHMDSGLRFIYSGEVAVNEWELSSILSA